MGVFVFKVVFVGVFVFRVVFVGVFVFRWCLWVCLCLGGVCGCVCV